MRKDHTAEDSSSAGEQHGDQGHRRGWPLWSAVAALVVAALVGGYALGSPGYPDDDSPEAGFLRDMSTHHAQAVNMSLLVLEESEDTALRTVAQDIARTQQEQIGRMQGWLVQWDLPARGPEPPMSWMPDHDAEGGMPGMASEERMEKLRTAEGEDAEIVFLRAMIDHHVGGVDMAEAAEELGEEPMVVDFAAGMAETQQSEIEMMREMLSERGVDPEDM
ncbi:uncharacterized protein (DUF305 family) [Haloactinospora alba]|uniref:Uncharacterized protein (DUF305 family) n=1 Tax=Haloactinospora alba TaxID=405555 RepID=A0A543NFY1_9ACTN|nr:DUF305 domain-containing protein [Haloactinospora alba]TQN30680.1 uncharacterized protein (DUF305 family) [Haloactinospora alba]